MASPETPTDPDTEAARNFIRDIVRADIEAGRVAGVVRVWVVEDE